MHDDALNRATEWIAGAHALLVCAGAGMGVDSGLPDFRGDEGFWRAYPPYARLGIKFVELADPEHFLTDPELAWGFYGHRLQLYRTTAPHRGFALLREWAAKKDGGIRVFTSNVDGHFQHAGYRDVAEVHGSIHHLQCTIPCQREIWSADDLDVPIDNDSMRALRPLPSCPHCGWISRPNILMFGDGDWIPDRSQQQLDALQAWRRGIKGLVVIELGAGQAVPTVRRQAELASAATGALIRINPREPEVRHGHGISLPLGAGEALAAIDQRLRGR